MTADTVTIMNKPLDSRLGPNPDPFRRDTRSTQENQHSFLLRAAIPTDAKAITALIHITFDHYIPKIGRVPSALLANYREVIERDRVWVVETRSPVSSAKSSAGNASAIAHQPDSLIAVLVLTLETNHHAPNHHYHINTLAVHPQHQRQGIGKALLRHAEQEAIAAGHPEIWLHTNETMTHNIRLYTSIGYEERYRKIKPSTNSIYMRKPL